MELKAFIKATAQSIIDASSELISENAGKPVFVNPKADSVTASEDWVTFYDGFLPVTRIRFDVAVTEEIGKSGDLGGKIKIASFEVGAGGEISRSDSTVSRISFDLRVALPGQDGPKREQRVHEFVSYIVP